MPYSEKPQSQDLLAGIGFTLRGDHDFTPSRFHYLSPPELFHPYYGVQNDGDLYSSENLRSLQALVRRQTDGEMLHMVMADGGFDVSGKENIQEVMNKQLLLTQCAAAVGTLRAGGHFVCKCFDLVTPFSAGLVYLMAAFFSSVSIHKPAQSRPANSERYLICRSLSAVNPPLFEHLLRVNDRLNKLKPDWPSSNGRGGDDVIDLVPQAMLQDSPVGQYLRRSNNSIGALQAKALRRLVAYMHERGGRVCDQSFTREECLRAWRMPLDVPLPLDYANAEDFFLHEVERGDALPRVITPGTLQPEHLDFQGAHALFKRVGDWVCMESSSDKPPILLLGLDICGRRGLTLFWDGRNWQEAAGVRLPRATLLAAERVAEVTEGRSLRDAMHVIDAAVIAGEDVRRLAFRERRRRLQVLVHALRREEAVLRQNALAGHARGRGVPMDEEEAGDDAVRSEVPLRLKPEYSFAQMEQALGECQQRSGTFPQWPCRGLFFFPGHGAPQGAPQPEHEWKLQRSQKTGQEYWYNVRTRESVWATKARPMSFRNCLTHLLRWGCQLPAPTKEDLLAFAAEISRA